MGSQVAVVHTFPSSQLMGVPGVHTPVWQVSAPLHGFPSEQLVLLGTFVCTQAPLDMLQLSLVHGFPSLQLMGVPGVQTPAWQVSAALQGLPSEQLVPLATAVWRQPSTGSQVSVVHGLPSSQLSIMVPARHDPLAHWSPSVHMLPSSHGCVLFTCTQPEAALHESSVQTSPSSQLAQLPPPVPHWPSWLPGKHAIPPSPAAETQPVQQEAAKQR